MTDEHVAPEPGSLAQEAALLAAAVREWLGAHGGPDAPAAPTGWDPFTTGEAADETAAEAPPAGGFHGPPWTVPPGATLCTGCPLCRLLATVAGSRGEVMSHLLSAAASLAAAARAAWPPADGAPPGPAASPDPPRQPTHRARSDRDRVQRIDISE
ncbi:hypothetical protein [Pseudofrankia inefficax]|uniref:Uncharacterized protein n=1 Tax=Pseudofrankia inefficax (strain DSM 45817 / CECT 9037 / DDB 130130 / EuI1c) TaxID=298654 RepID=E3JBJ3_PSEI1|nr:hypothetical protein [Pseudofrankia inefficax]ADP79865.1 hypothetical protein FraEuI1c_1809 [Pseudofrankia inefficax]